MLLAVNLLPSKMSIDAIAAVSDAPVSEDDVAAAFQSVDIEPKRDPGDFGAGEGFVYALPASTSESARMTLDALDLSDPDVIARVLRYTARVAELYAAGREARPDRLVRLRNSLHDDGYTL